MKLLPNWMTKRPYPPEYDLSGVIEDGNDSEFHAGDEVFGYIPADKAAATKQGALQQYARVPASALALRPRNVTPTEAAGFTLAAQTAWQALFKAGGFEAGQTILVNGASSSVGAFTVQIAKAKGAGRIVATASEKNEDFVRSLGADEFIDYTKEPLHKYLTKNPPSPKYHIIFDAGRFFFGWLCIQCLLTVIFLEFSGANGSRTVYSLRGVPRTRRCIRLLWTGSGSPSIRAYHQDCLRHQLASLAWRYLAYI